ncbi:MAG: AzlC family ABC transporter permease [Clostridia bacterium]|nr:AzlC family ABC transporter permease [Clostridia bacterium]
MKKNNGSQNREAYLIGTRDGVPIALGYFAVAFSLGIAARNIGMTPFQGFLASFLNMASAGEHAAFTSIAHHATYLEIALVTLVANARYLLMSCSLSQKYPESLPFYHRLLSGFGITDELFGICIARPGWLNPFYLYGAFLISALAWSSGTALGIIMGNLLPARAVSALSVALFGMFLAVIIPPARKSRVVACLIVIAFLLSYLAGVLPGIRNLSSGNRTILLTVLIAGSAAALFPVKDETEADHDAA